jgi:anti-sigma regulatory factor (Ser/Thr protein kinase)
MEWYVDAADVEAVRRSRHEFAAHVRQRAVDPGDVGVAEVAFSELVGNVHQHVGGPAWVSLDWSDDNPVLTVRDLGPGFNPKPGRRADPAQPSGRGLYLVQQLAGDVTVQRDLTGACVSVTLPIRREAPR